MLNYWGGAEHHKKTRGIEILTNSVSPMIIFACRTATGYALLVAAPHRKIARSRCVIFSIKKMLWVTGYTLAQNIQFQPNGLQRYSR